jgi:hypothetical protein
MQIPKDCKKVAIALSTQAAIADKASDVAGKTKIGLSRTSDILSGIVQSCNIGQMAATWYVKMSGQETHRIDMITAEKRFKFIKGILSGVESLTGVASATAQTAAEYAAFFPVIAEAIESLDQDVQKGKSEGWLDQSATSDPEIAEKQRHVYESASWFWGLHARLGDMQLSSQDCRVELKEMSSVTVGVLSQAGTLIDSIPSPPVLDEHSTQAAGVAAQYGKAITDVASFLSELSELLSPALDDNASAGTSTIVY